MEPSDETEKREESAIELEGIEKTYADGKRTVAAVSGVSVRVERGSMIVVAGPSGSGKTTLLGLMAGVVRPTRGTVRLLGKDITHMRDHHLVAHRRRGVGLVLQELMLVPKMSVVENALLPLVPLGGPRQEHLARIEALTERFGIAALRETEIHRLSGGERQRAAIVRALVLDPEVLLLDEPTAHLDAERAAQLVDLLATQRDDGRTIAIATHDSRVAGDRRIDHTMTLRDGKLDSATPV